eukprot:g4149.t1
MIAASTFINNKNCLLLLLIAGTMAGGSAFEKCCGPACVGCCNQEGNFCPANGLYNISGGGKRILPGVGGRGGGSDCSWQNPGCDTLPGQLSNPIDFTLDPSGRYLFVVESGFDLGLRDGNASRLTRYDLNSPSPDGDAAILSFCGSFVAIEFDEKRSRLVVLRNTNWINGQGQQRGGAEILTFDPQAPAADPSVKCHPGFDTNPSLEGHVIGRKGLVKDLFPARSMLLLGESETFPDSVLVGDQNNYCVLAFPADGSFGKDTEGKPAIGTCGHGEDVGVPVDTKGKAGSHLSNSYYHLPYRMYPNADAAFVGGQTASFMLHDQNHGTIDVGSKPAPSTDFDMVSINSMSSSLYFNPLFDVRHCKQNKQNASNPCVPTLIVRDGYSHSASVTRVPKGKDGNYDGSSKMASLLFDVRSWRAIWKDEHDVPIEVQGLPMRWRWTPKGTLLVLLSYSARNFVSAKLDSCFVEFNVPLYQG